MAEDRVERLLVASLHQGIADLLPNRLEFYEAWLSPAGLRDGRIGLAPFVAALSFLRQEGEAYDQVVARAGQCAVDWMVADVSRAVRLAIRVAPRRMRVRLAMRLLRRLVRRTYAGTRVGVLRRRDGVVIDIRASLFCQVRAPVARPLCGFYEAAVERLLHFARLDLEVAPEQCRGRGESRCAVTVSLKRPAARRAGSATA